jgi:hypothetical protein
MRGVRAAWSFTARVAVWSVSGSVLGTLAFSEAARQSWPAFVRHTAMGVVFSSCCIGLCFVALPALPRYARRRFRYPLNWVVVAAGLVVVSIVACAIGTALLVVTEFTPPRSALRLLQEALPTSTYFTLFFGMATSFVSESKERETAEARRLVAEAQLAWLESRVHPHFLFNTLNSIASMTHTDPPGAERMTHQLASLMRSSLDAASRPLVSLRDEIDLVRDYLAIERVRFGDRLRYTIDVDDRAADTAIPRLSLQTLAENSVKYAVSPQRGGASIAIRAVAQGTATCVEVEDDGPGFDPDGESPGHGLALLRARLAMSFESHARLDVQSRAGRTRVAIVVPSRGVPAT